MPSNRIASFFVDEGETYITLAETFDTDGYETGFRVTVDRNDEVTAEVFPVLSQALARVAVIAACVERNLVIA